MRNPFFEINGQMVHINAIERFGKRGGYTDVHLFSDNEKNTPGYGHFGHSVWDDDNKLFDSLKEWGK